MLAILIVLATFVRGFRRSMGDPEFRAIATMVGLLLVLGTVFYSNVEGWSALDSLYFSVITLATVGYGDFTPKTAIGKIFTMLYIIMGIGVIVTFAHRIARGARRERHRPHDADPGERGSHPEQ